jgi:hypothetical protein
VELQEIVKIKNMLNPEILPILKLKSINNDLIKGYSIQVCGHGTSFKTISSNRKQDNKYLPECIIQRLFDLSNEIENIAPELLGSSEICKIFAQNILLNSYSYSEYKKDRISLRQKLRCKNLSISDYQNIYIIIKRNIELLQN